MIVIRPWEIDQRRGATGRQAPTRPGYKPPRPGEMERQRSGGAPGRNTTIGRPSAVIAKGGIPSASAEWDATGPARAHERVMAYNNWRWANGLYPNQDTLMGQQQPMPQPTSGGSGGGWGGGGGGGTPALDPALFDQYAAQMMTAIKGIQPIADPLAGAYNPAIDQEIADVRAAYGGIADSISTADPFLSMIGQAAPTVDPSMAGFLQSQGMGVGDYNDAVALTNAQLQAGQDNWSNYAKAAGANHVAGQNDMITNAKLQGEQFVQGYEAQRQELANLVAAREAAEKRRVQDARLAAIMPLLASGLEWGRIPDISELFA